MVTDYRQLSTGGQGASVRHCRDSRGIAELASMVMSTPSEPFIPECGTPEAQVRRQSFGEWAQAYQRFRPGYPPQFYDLVLQRSGQSPSGLPVVDIGAGTGQLSRGFVERGCHVTAVEPDDRMRAVLAETTAADAVLAGSAEQIPVADGSAQIVAGGQMWHWVNEDLALPEVARVLAAGGLFAIVWTFRDDRCDWVRQLHEIAGLPDSYSYFVESDVPNFGEPFSGGEVAEIEFTSASTAADLVGLVGTFSHVGTSPNAAQILSDVQNLTQTHPDLAGRDSFEVPYVCKTFMVTRD